MIPSEDQARVARVRRVLRRRGWALALHSPDWRVGPYAVVDVATGRTVFAPASLDALWAELDPA